MVPKNEIASAIRETLCSPNVMDSNLEPANIVDAADRLAKALFSIGKQLERIAAAYERSVSEEVQG